MRSDRQTHENHVLPRVKCKGLRPPTVLDPMGGKPDDKSLPPAR